MTILLCILKKCKNSPELQLMMRYGQEYAIEITLKEKLIIINVQKMLMRILRDILSRILTNSLTCKFRIKYQIL